MKRNIYHFVVITLAIIASFASCTTFPTNSGNINTPKEVRKDALKYAEKYVSYGAIYKWGGQDPLPYAIEVDCSGLVVRCYEYACKDLGYRMPFRDVDSAGMQKYCDPVDPEPGDIIFMGERVVVTHIAIYKKQVGSKIYFIDSSSITGKV
ncbi:MAG: NlpC/P60 family protein, partial [Spirochaetes bacterium]|nr:NlpC/P60 family protein [Spirochaetota bacterium]